LDQRVVLFTADSVKAPMDRDVPSRREAAVADRGWERRMWAGKRALPRRALRAQSGSSKSGSWQS